MQIKDSIKQDFLKWSLFVILNFSVAFIVVLLLLTDVPNPYPILFLIFLYALEVYFFKSHKAKLLAMFLFFLVSIWFMLSIMDTDAVSKKCAPELRKQEAEHRNIDEIHRETANFDSCLSSITLLDNIKYGLLQ